jgi:hypothetical protein
MALSRKRSVSKKTSRRKSTSKKVLGSKKKTKKSVTKKTLRSKKKTSRNSVTKKTLRSKKKTSRKQKGGNDIKFTATKEPQKGTWRALGFEKERKFRYDINESKISWGDGNEFFCKINPNVEIVKNKETGLPIKEFSNKEFKEILNSQHIRHNSKKQLIIPCLESKRKGMNKTCTENCPQLVLRNIKKNN